MCVKLAQNDTGYNCFFFSSRLTKHFIHSQKLTFSKTFIYFRFENFKLDARKSSKSNVNFVLLKTLVSDN